MELTRTIICSDDEGNTYVVEEWQHFSTFRPLSAPPRKVPGSKELRLSDGGHVNYTNEADVFKILNTNTIIRAIG